MKLRFLSLFLFLSIAANATASITASPSVSPDGNFIVSWGNHVSVDQWKLKQSFNYGSWTSYTLSATTHSKVFTNKPEGSYRYRIDYCENLGHPDEWGCYDSGFGIVNVDVTAEPLPQPDPLADQMSYEYETRQGDINADGKQDIFLRRLTNSNVANGAVDRIILKQLSNGTFQAIVPTATQLSVAYAWDPISIGIQVLDLNQDGFVDIALTGVSSALSGAIDQIVFSPAQVLAQMPIAVTAMDQDFLTFLDETSHWAENPNYFDENAVLVQEPGHWEDHYECQWEYEPYQGWDYYCDTWFEWVDGNEYLSYAHFNQDALDYCSALEEMDANNGMTPGSSIANRAKQALERVFGAGVVDKIFAAGPIEIELPPLDTTSDLSWWRYLRVQLIWLLAAQIPGDTPQNQTLYRVVQPAELTNIQACHCFELLPGQLEFKQFWLNKYDAIWFGTTGLPNIQYHGPRTLVEVDVPKSIVAQGFRVHEPNTAFGHIDFDPIQLAELNAAIATKPIRLTFEWEGE